MSKIIYLIDFDGTMTHQDTTTTLGRLYDSEYTNNKVNELKENKISIKEYMTSVFKNMKLTEDEFKKLLKENIDLVYYVKEFIEEYPDFFIISSGTTQNILATLGANDIRVKENKIIANSLNFKEEGLEYVLHPKNSENGLDKKSILKEMKNDNPEISLIFIGDGISDLEAAIEADYVYAKKDAKLSEYCEKNNIEYTTFETFKDISNHLKTI